VNGAFLECCAGSCRLAQSSASLGIPSESYEILRDKREDICSYIFLKNLKSRIANKYVCGVWLGITCASFTLARRGNPDYSGWPPPLRSNDPEGIYGLPNLNAKDKERVRLGNRLANRAAVIIRLCRDANVPVFLENPASSRLWIFPPILRLLSSASQLETFHQCQYDSPYKKQTQIAMWNFVSTQLAKKCTGSQTLCSSSQKPHVVLSGTDPATGEFRTSQASAYPWKFARLFASELCRHVRVQ